jgi:hypothetical protein
MLWLCIWLVERVGIGLGRGKGSMRGGFVLYNSKMYLYKARNRSRSYRFYNLVTRWDFGYEVFLSFRMHLMH